MYLKESDDFDSRGSWPLSTSPRTIDVLDKDIKTNSLMSAFKFSSHEASTKVATFECAFCGVSFDNPSSLEVHISNFCIQKSSASLVDTFYSKFTNGSTQTDEIEKNTQNRGPSAANKDNGSFSPITNNAEPQATTTLTGAFRCQMCPFAADKKSRLVEHLSREHPTEEPAEEKRPSPPAVLEENMDTETGAIDKEEFHCSSCNIQFSSRNNYQAHKQYYCTQRQAPLFQLGKEGNMANFDMMKHPMVVPFPQIFPLLSPLGMTYSMHYMMAEVLRKYSAPIGLPEIKEHSVSPSPVEVKPAQDQPLDLSCKKPLVPESSTNQAKRTRRISDPGVYKSKFPAIHISQRFRKRSAGQLGPAKQPFGGAVTHEFNRCEECDIVFYKHENYVVHKEFYCAGRKFEETVKTEQVKVVKKIEPNEEEQIAVVSCPPSPSGQSDIEDASTNEYAMQFMCLPCKIKFSSLDTLEAHQQYYCPASRAFLTAIQASKAVSRSSTPEGVSCFSCSSKLGNKEELEAHMCTRATVKIPMFCCPYCDYVAQSDNRLLDHIKAHAPTKAYRCELCGYRGNTIRGMRMHGKSHIDAGAPFTDEDMIEYQEPPLIPKRLRTVTESVEVNVPASLFQSKIEQPRKRYSTEGAVSDSGQKRVRYSCPACNAVHTEDNEFKRHLETHLKTAPTADNKSSSGDEEEEMVVIKTEKSDTATSLSKHSIINLLKHGTSVNDMEEIKSKAEGESTTVNQRLAIDQSEKDVIQKEQIPTPDKSLSYNKVHYCEECDIPFVYLATFLAHKKYYCSSHVGERSPKTAQ